MEIVNEPKLINPDEGAVIKSLDELAIECRAGNKLYVNGNKMDPDIFEYAMFKKVREVLSKGMVRKVIKEPKIRMVANDLE